MHNAYQNYFENEILAADPLKLVQLLYRGALEAVGCARRYLRSGDIRSRSQAITKALAILHELTTSLDHSRGAELSRSLAGLYDYIERLLIDGNTRQVEAPFREAEQLLSTLLEAWQALTPGEPVAGANPGYGEPECESLSYA